MGCCWHKASWFLFLFLLIPPILLVLNIVYVCLYLSDYIGKAGLGLMFISPFLMAQIAFASIGLMYISVYYEYWGVLSLLVNLFVWLLAVGTCGGMAYSFQSRAMIKKNRTSKVRAYMGTLFLYAIILALVLFLSLIIYVGYFVVFRQFYEEVLPELKKAEMEAAEEGVPEQEEPTESTSTTSGFAHESYEGFKWGHVVHSARRTMAEADTLLQRNTNGPDPVDPPATTSDPPPRRTKAFLFIFGNN